MRKYRQLLALMLVFILAAASITGAATAYAADLTTQVVLTAKDNTAPIAENIDLCTYKDVPVTGTFKATDPDGDEVSFSIDTEPKKGTVALGEDGAFTYTPNEGKKGKDSFTYTASDSSGAVSASATVSVVIEKQSTKITYSDMDGNSAHYAALLLAENGIYVGQKLGDEYFFCPDDTVSRGEFLAMCMNLNDSELLSGVTRTGFYDDGDMAQWEKTYVSTALMSGIISGYKDKEGHLVFGAENDITYSQAAVMLNNVLGISDVVSVGAMEQADTPNWAYQAAVNLNTCGIVSDSISTEYSHTLTRGEAAQLLAGAVGLLEARAG